MFDLPLGNRRGGELRTLGRAIAIRRRLASLGATARHHSLMGARSRFPSGRGKTTVLALLVGAFIVLLQATSAPATPGVFSLDRLLLGSPAGAETYVYTAGNVIVPDGGADLGRSTDSRSLTRPGRSATPRSRADPPTRLRQQQQRVHGPVDRSGLDRHVLEVHAPAVQQRDLQRVCGEDHIQEVLRRQGDVVRRSRAHERQNDVLGRKHGIRQDRWARAVTNWSATWLLLGRFRLCEHCRQ